MSNIYAATGIVNGQAIRNPSRFEKVDVQPMSVQQARTTQARGAARRRRRR